MHPSPRPCVPLPPPVPGIWGGVTCDPDADRRAFLRSMVRVGGHAAIDALILMPYLRQEQHRARGKGQRCTLVRKRQGTWKPCTHILDPSSPDPHIPSPSPSSCQLSGCLPRISPLPLSPSSPGHSHLLSSGSEEEAGQRWHRSGSQSHQGRLFHLQAQPTAECPLEAQALGGGEHEVHQDTGPLA